MVTATVLFFFFLLMHIIDDFVLQPKSLGHLKQKTWWEFECEARRVELKKYQYDYIAALIIHGLSWSIMIHLPVIFLYNAPNNIILPISIILMGLLHSLIDHLKANVGCINLCIDQLLHLMQLILIWFYFK